MYNYKEFQISSQELNNFSTLVQRACNKQGQINMGQFIECIFKEQVNTKWDHSIYSYNKKALVEVNTQTKTQVLTNVVEIDFKSYYPNLLLKSEFANQDLKQFIAKSLYLRFNTQNQTVKSIIKEFTNKIVGCFGSNESKEDHFKLRNYKLHEDIIRMAREITGEMKNIIISKGYQYVCAYTDAVFFQIKEDQSDEIIQYIQQYMLDRYELETESIRYNLFRHCFATNKYLSILQNGQVKIRGISKQIVNDKLISAKLVKEYFDNNCNIDIFYSLVERIKEELDELQLNQELVKSELIRMLSYNRNINDTMCQLVRLVDGTELQIDQLQSDFDVDIDSLLSILRSNINSILKEDNSDDIIKEARLQSKYIVLRRDRINKTTKKVQITDSELHLRNPDMLYKQFTKSKQEIPTHEVFGEIVKFFVDIDHICLDEYHSELCLQSIKESVAPLLKDYLIYTLNRISDTQIQNIDFAIASYIFKNKVSCHIVYQVGAQMNLVKQIISDFKEQHQYPNLIGEIIKSIDMCVYAVNKSLRLPLTPKIVNDTLRSDMILQVESFEDFKKCFITDLQTVQIVKCLYVNRPVINYTRYTKVESSLQKYKEIVRQVLQNQYQIQVTDIHDLKQSSSDTNILRGRIRHSNIHPCIIHKRQHKSELYTNYYYFISNNDIKICCYKKRFVNAFDKKSIKIPILDTSLRGQVENIIHDNFTYVTDSVRYLTESSKLDYYLNQKCLAINSNMGSGKTKFLISYLQKHLNPVQYVKDYFDNKYILPDKDTKSVCYITTRKSFTEKLYEDFKQFNFIKYNDEQIYDRSQQIHCNSKNYTDNPLCQKCLRFIERSRPCKHHVKDLQYVLDKNTQLRVICQIESLVRIDNQVNILILDEWISILEQIQSTQTNTELLEKLIKMIQGAQQVVVLDHYLSDFQIEMLKQIRDDFIIFGNKFQNWNQTKVNIIKTPRRGFNKDISDMFVQRVLHYTQQDKRVGCYISSRTVLDTIYNKLVDQHIKVLRLDGDNGREEEINGQQQIHYQTKQQVFKDVNEQFDNYQVILYSSTLTIGISYDKELFDTCVNLITPRCCSLYQSLQAMLRFRKAKEITVYFDNLQDEIQQYQQQTLQSYMLDSSLLIRNDVISYVNVCAQVFQNNIRQLGYHFIVNEFKRIGMSVNITHLSKDVVQTCQRDQLVLKSRNKIFLECSLEQLENELQEYLSCQQGMRDKLPYTLEKKQIFDMYVYDSIYFKDISNYSLSNWLEAYMNHRQQYTTLHDKLVNNRQSNVQQKLMSIRQSLFEESKEFICKVTQQKWIKIMKQLHKEIKPDLTLDQFKKQLKDNLITYEETFNAISQSSKLRFEKAYILGYEYLRIKEGGKMIKGSREKMICKSLLNPINKCIFGIQDDQEILVQCQYQMFQNDQSDSSDTVSQVSQ